MRRSARLSSRNSQLQQNLEGNSSEVRLPPPKRRKTKASASSASVKGKLAALFELPLDILYEILSNTHPIKLLQISRATKTLRRTLMSQSSIWIWRRSYAAYPELPAVPEDMNIPQFMSLAVDTWCYFCGQNCGGTICWLARTRSCQKCLKSTKHWFRQEQMKSKDALRIIGGGNLVFQATMTSLFPYVRIPAPSRPYGEVHYLASSVRIFLLKSARDNVANMSAAQRDKYLWPMYDELERREEHARNCEQWIQGLKEEAVASASRF